MLPIALALVLCWLTWLAPAADSKRPVPTHLSSTSHLGGVNITGLYPGVPPERAAGEIAAARKLHANVVRAGVPWSAFQPLGPNSIDPRALAYTDRLVGDAAAAGIRVIVIADSTPCWASSAPASLLRACVPRGSSPANAWPPANPADYAAFVAYLARRYGTHVAIEVWNEPDQANELYFAGPNKAARYAAILRAAYPAVKHANPAVQVLAGSLVGSNGIFLRLLYAAGIKGNYDGLAVHYYDLTLASLRSIHEVQLANGDPQPLWLDEFGWSSCYPRHLIQEEQACVTAQMQGGNLADIFHSLARTSYVAAVVSYTMQDAGSELFGVLTAGGARKPAYSALSRALASPFRNPRAVTLRLRSRGGHVVASGSGPVGDYMQIEAFQGSVLRYRAVFVADRFNRFSITLPSVLGTRGLSVRVYQYWTGPGRSAQRGI
jgi:polysaccharide biosynthesis protein PslG